ncbi:MAG: hypothetical protein JXR88_08660 [Clostridia bacterium]|nr:hypothetical protein [Clostridia bacterium]
MPTVWIYAHPSQYLYDILVMLMMVLMGKQLFNLTMTWKQVVAFVSFMMIFYQINFLFVERLVGKGPKYVVLYLGLFIAYMLIIKLNWLSALVTILTMSAFNGIWTNINILLMLSLFYDDYAEALSHQHAQYTFYVVTVMVLAGFTILSKFKLFDIQKYN